jgi:hypothetical protein
VIGSTTEIFFSKLGSFWKSRSFYALQLLNMRPHNRKNFKCTSHCPCGG